jgi:hypothetical protein
MVLITGVLQGSVHIQEDLYAYIWPSMVIKSQNESHGISTSPVWQWQEMTDRLAMDMVFISANNRGNNDSHK